MQEFKANLANMVTHLRAADMSSIVLIAPPPVCETGRIKHNSQVCHSSSLYCFHGNNVQKKSYRVSVCFVIDTGSTDSTASSQANIALHAI